jgi:hypothetical protein
MEGMTRGALVALVLLTACHHKKRTVYAADGSCSDPAGCVPPPDYPNEYRAPDDEHPGTGVDPWGPGPTGETRQATCDDVGHALASIELGNWADENALAPLIAKHRAACVTAKLDQDERQCVFEATDTTGITYCAPRMTPGARVEVVAAKDCAPLMTMMRTQSRMYSSHPLIEKQLAAIEESCAQDRWTIPFGDCVRNLPLPSYVGMYCAGAGPAPLRKKVETRLAQVK